MRKFLLPLLLSVLFAALAGVMPSHAANGIVKMKTDAAAGTKLRIFTYPYNPTVDGVDNGDFVGEFFSKGPGSEITITCDNLQQLEVYGCELTELAIVDAPKLYILKCYDNKLSSLDVSTSTELAILNCNNNSLSSLDITPCTKLEEVYAAKNNLSAFTLGSKPVLKTIECGYNPLATLDLSQCPALEEIHFQKCNLSSLNLSHNTKLWWILAFGNNIKGESMDNFIANLPEAATTGMLYIVDTTDNDETNVCTMENVRAAATKGWATMDYTGGKGSETQMGVFYPGCDYVPAVSNNKITLTTSRAVGETIKLNIKSTNSIEISGIAETSNLTGSNTFTLTSQTVEIRGKVTLFECEGNDITALSFEDPSPITYLDCRNNKIETLNLQGASALASLYAQKNNLSSLNLADCNKLFRVDCYANNLKGSAMTDFVNSLPTSTNEPYLFIIDTKDPNGTEHNVATTTQVKIATDKGWVVYDYSNGDRYGMGVIYEGSQPTQPEEYFTFTRVTKGEISMNISGISADNTPEVEGGTVIAWNGSGLMIRMDQETVKVYGDITTIQMLFSSLDAINVTNLPNLSELNVGLNNITTLDLSKSAKLKTLSCEANLLEALDLTQCPAIEYINCYGNRIKGQPMTQMMESLPTRTRADYGQIIIRDPSYAEEYNICLTTDVDIALKKAWVTYEIDANDNLVQYFGVAPDGITDIDGGQQKPVYDATTATVIAPCRCDITVHNLSGQTIAKATDTDRLCIKDLPAGIYIIRAANTTLKITK